jgi:transcriptional regulator with XRE-family HTH domain
MKKWEQKVLGAPGAAGRVAQIEEELRLAAGLTRLREQAGLTQRELAEKIGVRQPRIAAIERSRNVTIEVLERYVDALGGRLELSVVQAGTTIPLISSADKTAPPKKTQRRKPAKTAARTVKAPASAARATPSTGATAGSPKPTARDRIVKSA